MKTMLDFKNFLVKEFGPLEQFLHRSVAHQEFWKKLNNIGWRKKKAQPSETVLNVDATADLTEQEWAELEAELRQLG